MDKDRLARIIDLHEKWVNGQKEGARANLRGTDLNQANLRGANLRGTDLNQANLRGANLRGADLSYANLKGTDLNQADLRGTDLNQANLRGANLRGADLSYADLKGTDLNQADLRGADLSYADLDYSCLPLWCGSLSAHFDNRQLRQIAYHLVKAGLTSRNASADTKAELAKLIDFANGFHRADECGRIVTDEGERA